MLSNTDYLKWMESFIIEQRGFSDDGRLYRLDELSDDDREYMNSLDLFYQGIEEYAKENHIDSMGNETLTLYRISLGNVGYEIGKLGDEEPVFFFHRVPVEEGVEFIDFNDIINNNKGNKRRVISLKR